MSNIYGECIHGNNLATCVKCKFGEDYSDIMKTSDSFEKITESNDALYLIDLYRKEEVLEIRSLITTRIVELKMAMTTDEAKEFGKYALPYKFFVAPKKYIL